jgi:hypothetical protein
VNPKSETNFNEKNNKTIILRRQEMTEKPTKENQKNNNYTSIRVKLSTKESINKFIEKINNTEDCGKITFDALANYLLNNISKEDIDNLQLKSVTWTHEDKRLRRLWEKKKGKVSENKWKEMLYMGQLQSFIKEHSRITIR